MSLVTNVELSHLRRGRVWIGELPDVSYISISAVNLNCDASRSIQEEIRVGAVEVLIPTGGRYLYGLVGGTFRADVTGKFCADVGISAPDLGVWEDSLASRVDRVHKGLLQEYAPAVIRGLEQENGNLTSGYINVNCAAHAEVGSAQVVFKYLGAALWRLFGLADAAPSKQQLVDLFPTLG